MTTDASEQGQVSTSHTDTERPLTAFGALLGVIVRPRATFRGMREARRGHWWVVLLLTLVTLALVAVVTSKVSAAQFAEFQAQREAALAESNGEADTQGGAQAGTRGGGPGGGPPGGGGPGFVGGPGGNPVGFLTRRIGGGTDGSPTAGPTQSSLGIAISVGTGLVSALLGYLLRGVLLLLFGLVLGGRATFKQVFRMGVWTTFPSVVRNVVQLILTAVTGRLPAPGLAGIAFGSQGVSRVMLTVLRGIDIYLLWSLILVGVGVAATTQLSRIKSTLVALGYWLLTVAASAGWAALLPTLFGFGR